MLADGADIRTVRHAPDKFGPVQELAPQQPPVSVLVTRRPVCDLRSVLRGYEILADDFDSQTRQTLESTETVSRAIHVVAGVIGVDTLAGENSLLFVPIDESALLLGHHTMLPPGRTVFILRGNGFSEGAADRCVAARRRGYEFAVDQQIAPNRPLRIESIASYVKVDLGGIDDVRLAKSVAAAHLRGCKLIATGVDDNAGIERTARAGCDLIQGRFLLAADPHEAREIPGSAVLHCRLLSLLTANELDRTAIAETIEMDVSLAHALLRRINSAAMGVPQRVSSIPAALSLLGDEHVRCWGGLTALAALKTHRSPEPLLVSLVRARFCSRLACACSHQDEAMDAYFVGLFSALDVVLGVPMDRALASLSLTPSVVAALTGDRSGVLGRLFMLAEACERGAWSTVHECRHTLGIAHSSVTNEYFDALDWARRMLNDGGTSEIDR